MLPPTEVITKRLPLRMAIVCGSAGGAAEELLLFALSFVDEHQEAAEEKPKVLFAKGTNRYRKWFCFRNGVVL
jgi:hypothetical protein